MPDMARSADDRTLGHPRSRRSERLGGRNCVGFKDAYRMLFQRIGIFTAIPIRNLDKLSLQNKLREIGHMNMKLVEPS